MTRPDGKLRNMKVNNIGIISMIFACEDRRRRCHLLLYEHGRAHKDRRYIIRVLAERSVPEEERCMAKLDGYIEDLDAMKTGI